MPAEPARGRVTGDRWIAAAEHLHQAPREIAQIGHGVAAVADVPAVIASGIFIGVNDTITTQAVMTVSPVERPVASGCVDSRSSGHNDAPWPAWRRRDRGRHR